MLKRTPLFDVHVRSGGRMVEFGGWEMPVQYTSIVDEHLAVRKAAGIFDIAHMGEVMVSGEAAADFLNHSLTNDIRKLFIGLGQYTLMCNERGGVVDDLYAYRLGENEYLLIINASRIDADVEWLSQLWNAFPAREKVTLRNVSDTSGAVAIQGPAVATFINSCFTGKSTGGLLVECANDLKKNEIGQFDFNGQPVWVSRTGYTGEDGFEVVAENALLTAIWDKVCESGKASGLVPAGLGARDTLRTEVCYPLYGHELDENTTPIEAGVGSFAALDKGDFVGKTTLASQKAGGVSRKCVAFKMTDKSPPPRPQYTIWKAGDTSAPIGTVVSGTQSPSLSLGIGMGYVPATDAKPGTPLEIEIRGRRFPAVTVGKPIYRK